MELSVKDYHYDGWADLDEIYLEELSSGISSDWKEIFSLLFDKEGKKIKHFLEQELKKKKTILPYPRLLFKTFEAPLKNVKAVIIGQDPYPRFEKGIPQAMGLSFSVPHGLETPSSLRNIYQNLQVFGHLEKIPSHGNLERLLHQGVLFLNATMTVEKDIPNSHQGIWDEFTDSIIYLLSDRPEIKFVLWGKNAITKKYLVQSKNYVASSHPSGLSCNKPCGVFPAFMKCDFSKNLGIDWNVLLD